MILGRVLNIPGNVHPHVVALGNSTSSECLLVPSFSAGGDRNIENLVNELKKAGWPREHVVIEGDNTIDIEWHRPYHAKVAVYWVLRERVHLPTPDVSAIASLGKMKREPLCRIIKGLHDMGNAHGMINPKMLRKLASLHERLCDGEDF